MCLLTKLQRKELSSSKQWCTHVRCPVRCHFYVNLRFLSFFLISAWDVAESRVYFNTLIRHCGQGGWGRATVWCISNKGLERWGVGRGTQHRDHQHFLSGIDLRRYTLSFDRHIVCVPRPAIDYATCGGVLERWLRSRQSSCSCLSNSRVARQASKSSTKWVSLDSRCQEELFPSFKPQDIRKVITTEADVAEPSNRHVLNQTGRLLVLSQQGKATNARVWLRSERAKGN